MTTNPILLQNIAQFQDPTFNKTTKKIFGQPQKVVTVEKIRAQWKDIIEANRKKIEQLYYDGIMPDWTECRAKKEANFDFEDEVYALMIKWLKTIDWSDLSEARALYYYVDTVSSSDYKPTRLVLLKYHKQILALLQDYVQRADFQIFKSLHNGNFGAIVENLFHLYFYHTIHSWGMHYKEQYDIDRKDIAELIPSHIKRFPKNSSGLLLSILKDHSEPIHAFAELVQFYMCQNTDDNYCPIASELFSTYNEPSDYFYNNAAKVIAQTLKYKDYTNTEANYLVESILLSQLGINSKEDQLQGLQHHLQNLKDNDFEQKVITKYEKDIAELDEVYEKEWDKNWAKAIRRVAVSKPTSESITHMIKAYPNHPKTPLLKKLFAEAEAFKNQPKLYELKQKPAVLFKDLHFKYLVIEELMYQQKILKPIFDIKLFAKEYTKKEIDTYSYEVIPEATKYFKNLDIPEELLAKVTTLYQDSGINGGSDFIYNLYPAWDPGAGDDVFKVGNKAITDLVLLPNLKKIVGLEISSPSRKLKKAILALGIELVEEED